MRLEIVSALERNIRVLPVLLNETPMPTQKQIPDSLMALANRQACLLREHRWAQDVMSFAALLLELPDIRVAASESAESARMKLAEVGIDYNEEAFFERLESGDSVVIRWFLNAGFDPNSDRQLTDSYGIRYGDYNDRISALAIAASRNYFHTAMLLANEGASINRAISRSVAVGREPVLTHFLSKKPEQEAVDAAFLEAAKRPNSNATTLLLKHGVSESSRLDSIKLFAMACEWQTLELIVGDIPLPISVVTEALGNLLQDSSNSLMSGEEPGLRATVEFLVEKGADLRVCDESGNTSLNYAIGKNSSESLIRWLLLQGVDVNCIGKDRPSGHDLRSPLIEALQSEREDIALLLMENGADPNLPAGEMTPLMMAARKEQCEMLSELLKRGAVATMEVEGKSAIGLSFNIDIVDQLLNAGANITRCNAMALHLSRLEGGVEILQLLRGLFQRGVDVNLEDETGATLLIRAVQTGNHRTIRVLLMAGANADAQDAMGFTALDHAERKDDPRLVRLLSDETTWRNVA